MLSISEFLSRDRNIKESPSAFFSLSDLKIEFRIDIL